MADSETSTPATRSAAESAHAQIILDNGDILEIRGTEDEARASAAGYLPGLALYQMGPTEWWVLRDWVAQSLEEHGATVIWLSRYGQDTQARLRAAVEALDGDHQEAV